MHFLIFVPEGRDVGSLAEVGLSDLAQGAFARLYDRNPGPGGCGGVMFGWPVNGVLGPVQYLPDEQDWFPAVPFQGLAAGRYHVGIWRNKRPVPSQLQRPRFYGGHAVALGDGFEWSVPSIGHLPHVWAADTEGGWKLQAKSEFRHIVARAYAWRLQCGPGAEVSVSDAIEFALQALSINYRLTRELATALELFTDGAESTLRTCFAHCAGIDGAGGDA